MFDLCLDNRSDREEVIMSKHEIEKTVSKSSVFSLHTSGRNHDNYLFCGHQVLNTAHVSQCYHPATTSCLDRIPGSNVAFIFQNFKNDLVLILCFLVKTHDG